MLSLGLALHWTEQTERTQQTSQRALTLAGARLDDLVPIRLSLLSASHAMRGERGDVRDRWSSAKKRWTCGRRVSDEFAHHLHIYANPMYWSGRYQETYDLSMQAKSFGGSRRTALSSCCAVPA